MKIAFIFVLVVCAIVQVYGHGALYDPPGRSSAWRFGFNTPPNYDDNQLYCGGAGIQWGTYGGKCGLCGDSFGIPPPRPNENGGVYGQKVIVKEYRQGQVIDVTVHLTTAHKGDFTFSICNLDTNTEEESNFQPLKLSDGSEKFTAIDTSRDYKIQLQLPQGLTCNQCSFRWHYRTGNSYGQCDDGTWATGCGPQETFRSCADVKIV